MVVFDTQIYLAQMEWGDESNKQWFKIAQLTIIILNDENCSYDYFIKLLGLAG